MTCQNPACHSGRLMHIWCGFLLRRIDRCHPRMLRVWEWIAVHTSPADY